LAIGAREKVRVRRLAITMLLIVPLVAGGVLAQQKAGKDSVYEELNLFDEASSAFAMTRSTRLPMRN